MVQSPPTAWTTFQHRWSKNTALMDHFSPAHYGKTPCTVAADERLDLLHLRMYVFMAASVRKGSTVSNIGQRRLAGYLKISHQTVGRRLQDLVDWGLIKPVSDKRGRRGLYEMLSPVFSAVQKSTRRGAGQPGKRISPIVAQARAWAKIQAERMA